MRIEGADLSRYLEAELERDPSQWDDGLSRKRLVQNALLVSVGGSALLKAATAAGAVAQPRAASAGVAPKTTMVAAQRVAAASLNIDTPTYRSEVVLSCYPGFVDIYIPNNFDDARKQLSTKGQTVVPALAKSWKTNKAQTAWTFDLQTTKSFYGNSMQAADVQWSADKWTAGAPAQVPFVAGFLASLIGIRSKDQIKALTPTRIRIDLTSTPPSFFLAILSLPFMTVYDSTEIKKHTTAGDVFGNNWLRGNTAGFGPYHVQSNSPTGDQQVFVANPGWWGNPKVPAIKRVNRLAITESSQRLQLLLAGQADLADELTPVELDTVTKSKNAKVVVYSTSRTMFIAINNSKSPFDNPTIRKGIARAIPYDDIIKFVYRGRAKRWKTVIVPFFPGATDEFWKFDTNVAAAKQLLAPIASVPLTLNYPLGAPADEQVAILVQQGLRSAGLNVKLEGLDGAVYNAKKFTGQLDFYTDAQDTPIVADPAYDLNRYFPTKNPLQPLIIRFKGNAELDDLIARANTEVDFDKRLALIRQIQKVLVPQVPFVPIAWTGSQTSLANGLTGLRTHAYTFEYYQDLSWK